MLRVARAAVVWSVRMAAGAILVALAWYSATHAVDFPVYHRAGAAILSGSPELYPPGLYAGETVDAHGFRYAPSVALLFVPLALLPLEIAAALFFAVKITALAGAFVIVARRSGMASRWWHLLSVSFLLTGGYLLEELRNGNVHLLLVCLIVFAFDAAERRRWLSPAAALAMAIAAKLMPFALLVYAALRRRLAFVAATLALLVVLWFAPAFVWGWAWQQRLTTGFLTYSAQKMQEGVEGRNYSLRGALRLYRPFGVSLEAIDVIWWTMLAGATAVLVVVARRRNRATVSSDFDLALLLTAMPLLAPHTQRIHFAALIVPVAIVIGHLRQAPAVPLRGWLIASLALTAVAGTVLPAALPGRSASLGYLDLSPYTWATSFLAVVLLGVVCRGAQRVDVTDLTKSPIAP
jgi:alpha-1,2-mannosyltransferase